VHEVLRSPGQSLDSSTRSFFEQRFGHDFSQVRVHADKTAGRSATAVNATAYTVGRDIVFQTGSYAPESFEGRRLLAHELTHVVQQQSPSGTPTNDLPVGAADTPQEQEATKSAAELGSGQARSIEGRFSAPSLQRDLARPPKGAPAPVKTLTEGEVNAAIAFNEGRFRDPYSIRVIRDVLGVAPTPAVVDEELVQAIVRWQAERRLTQDGKIGHPTTRSIYLELVAEGELRKAILLLMDSYALPDDLRLGNVQVGAGANCCGAHGDADAVTFGGPHCPPVGGPVRICFCRAHVPRTAAQYDHFVRIVGHELIHVPQCAAGTGNVHVDEFEAFFFEACGGTRAPQLAPANRVAHANIALGHFAAIPAALQTAARIAMRNRLNALIAAAGAGPC